MALILISYETDQIFLVIYQVKLWKAILILLKRLKRLLMSYCITKTKAIHS
jgi:hypothetical protein